MKIDWLRCLMAAVIAALTFGLAPGARAATVEASYRYAVYNTDGTPASGIKEWKTGVATATVIDTQTSLSAGWYVVNVDKTISSRITCNGDVHLILADGCKLTASGTDAGISVTGSSSLTIYGQEGGTGTLEAKYTGTNSKAGIGGYNSDSYRDAGPITIHGGIVMAQGGKYASGIGGGYSSNTGGSGIGITINGGTVTATGGSYGGAGIGSGKGGIANNIVINGGHVTANGGDANAHGVGNGNNAATQSSDIFADSCVMISVSSDSNNWIAVSHETGVDMASNIKYRYFKALPPPKDITIAACEHGTVTASASTALLGETVSLSVTPDSGFVLASIDAHKTDEESTKVTLTAVKEGAAYTFSMPNYAVTVSATFVATEAIPSAPTAVEHATYQVYTNGVLSTDGTVWSNAVATVVYTTADGYVFYDGMISTNRLDTTVNPAVNRTVPVAPFRPEDVLVLGNFNFGSMTFPRVDGLDVGSYRQLTIMLSREMSGETIELPTVAGYTYNTSLSTDYSYVIDIDAPGKTAAEIAQYIRQVVFNGCRDQHVRIILDARGTAYRTFYSDETRHYYQYVPFATHNEFTWTECYEKARAMTYVGRRGYLATVMSQDEDVFIYKASADPDTGKGRVGWMGGTSCKHGDADGDLYYKSFDPAQLDSVSSEGIGHWYWACGPERGQDFFDWAKNKTQCTTEIYTRNAVTNQYYFNWDALGTDQNEPNGWSQSGGYERFLTTLGFGYGYNTDPASTSPGSKLDSNVYGWNDLKHSGNVGGKAKWDVLGFMVEFGDLVQGDTTEGSFIPGYVMVEQDIRAPIVTYDAGKGMFPDGETTNVVTQLNAADGYELPAESPTYAEHHLVGWYTNVEDTATLVMAGTPLYSRNDHTVYAKWAEGSYTNVTAETDGGEKIDVDLPEEELEERGGDPNKKEENDNRVWENIVAGLDGNGHVATGARQSASETKLNAVAANLDVPPADTGITVTYHLDRVSSDGKTRKEEVDESNSPNGLSVDLRQIESNDYFKVRIVLSQEGSGFEKEFVATNTMGVLKQTQNAESVVLSVPWGALTAGEDAEVAVADLIKTATLTAGDQLRVYRPSSKTYETWQLDANRTWQPVNNVAVGAGGAAKLSVAEGANEATIPRGSGVWLCRKSNTSAPYYLYGQVQTNAATTVLMGGTKTSPTWNLIGSPGVSDLDLNVQFGSGSSGDKIMVPTGYAPKNYTYKNGQWGYNVTVPVYSPTNKTQQIGVRMQRKTDDTEVPPGTGFWYINYSGEKNVEWK